MRLWWLPCLRSRTAHGVVTIAPGAAGVWAVIAAIAFQFQDDTVSFTIFLPSNSYESTSKHILWVCLIVTILLKSGWLSYLHTLRRGCVPGGCLPVVDRAWGCHSDSPQVRPTTERWSPWPPFRLSGVQFLLQYLSNSPMSRILNVSDLPMGHLYFASLLFSFILFLCFCTLH